MKAMIKELKRAVGGIVALVMILCVFYPMLVWCWGQLLFREKANGSLLEGGKGVVGSRLIAQPFVGARYFHPRPSAVNYAIPDANSGGSNLGPLSKRLREEVMRRARAYRRENGLAEDAPIPVDAVTASGSGLDPHISLVNARLQARRIARARGISMETVLRLVDRCLEGRQLGLFGEERINVLRLNLELDEKK